MARKSMPDHLRPPRTLRQRAEERARTSAGEIAEMSAEDVQRLLHELQIHQIELELQNEELRNAQVELAESRDRYSDLYEFAPVGYVTLNTNGKILEANLTAARMLGVERRDLLQMNISKFESQESMDSCYLHLQAVFSSESRQTCEMEMRRADGAQFEGRLESITFRREPDLDCRTAIIDVTDLKVAEEALHKLNVDLGRCLADRTTELQQSINRVKLLTEAVANLGEGVMITDDDLDWPGAEIVFVNQAMCEISGYAADELTGQRPQMLQGTEISKAARAHMRRQLDAGLSCLIELTNYRQDGTPYDAELFITPLLDAAGRRTNFVSIHRDISRRKRAEERLRASEERFRKVFENAATGIAITDCQDQFQQCNPAYCALLGYSAEELQRITVSSLVHSDDRAANLAGIDRLRAGELSFFEIESRELHKSGEAVWVRKFVSVLPSEMGAPTHLMALVTDISGRKRAEFHSQFLDRLNSTLMLERDPSKLIPRALRSLAEHLGVNHAAFNEFTQDGAASSVAHEYCDGPIPGSHRAVDLLTDEALQQLRSGHGHVIHDVASDPRTAALVDSFPEIEVAAFVSEPLITTDGPKAVLSIASRKPRLWRRDEVQLVHETAARLYSAFERAEADQALRDSEQRLRAVLNTAADAIITIDQQGTIASVNPATSRMFGYSESELLGQDVKLLMPPVFRDEHEGCLARFQPTGEARMTGIGGEVVAQHKDGSTFPVGLAVSQIDHLGLFTGIVRDISVMRELQKQVLEIAAEEDQRIGHELHDNIQQQLTGLGLLARSLADSLADKSLPETSLADRLAVGINQSARDVHLLSRGLVPVEVDAQGLQAALSELASTINEQHGVQCEFQFQGPVDVTDNFVATHLYRIAQEAVNNALKHGRGDRVEISLRGDDETISLNVLDNGVGIGNADSTGQGMGLRIMHYRAGLIGGTIQVKPADERGTLVGCRIITGAACDDK